MGKRKVPTPSASPKTKTSPKKAKVGGVSISDLTNCGGGSFRSSQEHSDGKVHVWIRTFCNNGSLYDKRFASDRLDVIQFSCVTADENPLRPLKISRLASA